MNGKRRERMEKKLNVYFCSHFLVEKERGGSVG